LNFLRQDNCGCFLFGSICRQFPEFVSLPVDPPLKTRVGFVWRKGRYMRMSMEAFLKFCRARYGSA